MYTEFVPIFLISTIGVGYAIATIRNPKKWARPLSYIGGPTINLGEKTTKFFGFVMLTAFSILFLISFIRTFTG